MTWMWLLAQADGGAADGAATSWRDWLDPKVLGEFAITFGKSLLVAIVIFVVGRWVAGLVDTLFRRVLRKANVEETLVSFFGNIVHGLLLVFVVLAALEELGVDTTSASAIIAAAGLAVGFALQGSLGNFAAGVMMVFFKPIKVGDLVEAGGTFGHVREIALFATVIETPGGKRVTVPNAGITGGNIENWSTYGRVRVEMTFGIGYDDDIDRAKETLREVLAADRRVLAEPAPVVAVKGHGASSVDLACYPWCDPADYWGVWFDTHEAVKKAFDARGISIPFPQRDVHLHTVA